MDILGKGMGQALYSSKMYHGIFNVQAVQTGSNGLFEGGRYESTQLGFTPVVPEKLGISNLRLRQLCHLLQEEPNTLKPQFTK